MSNATETITGPTDPESPWKGAPVTLARVRLQDVNTGMVIGFFADWHFGGPQPANLLSVHAVARMAMTPEWDRGRYLGQRVTLGFDSSDTSVADTGDAFAWQFIAGIGRDAKAA
jgi:hypothetical protein